MLHERHHSAKGQSGNPETALHVTGQISAIKIYSSLELLSAAERLRVLWACMCPDEYPMLTEWKHVRTAPQIVTPQPLRLGLLDTDAALLARLSGGTSPFSLRWQYVTH